MKAQNEQQQLSFPPQPIVKVKPKYCFSPYSNEYDIMQRVQEDYDNKINNLKSLTLSGIASLLDDLELQMDYIDGVREKPIFFKRLRKEWIDTIIKRYLQKGGEVGTEVSKEEAQKLNLMNPLYRFPFELMRKAFEKKKKNSLFSEHTDFFQILQAITEKYNENLILFVNNLKISLLPLIVIFRFKNLNDLTFEIDSKGKAKKLKRRSAQYLKNKDLYNDQLKQIEQVLSSNQIDFLKLEGNIAGKEIKDLNIISEYSYMPIIRGIKNGTKFVFLDLSNIKVKDIKKNCTLFGGNKYIENQNMIAIKEILEAIINSQGTVGTLKALSLQNVEFNQQVAQSLEKILKENCLEDLYLNGCKIGKDQQILRIILAGISHNTSLKGLELNENCLSDTMGVSILKTILGQICIFEELLPLKLIKLCLRDNELGENSAELLNQIIMKSQMRFIDLRGNQIVLRFLDNLIVSAGYKFNLEYFGIEQNKKNYKSSYLCNCGPSAAASNINKIVITEVSQQQLRNRDLRVKKNDNLLKFLTAKTNIQKQRIRHGVYLLNKRFIQDQKSESIKINSEMISIAEQNYNEDENDVIQEF